MWRSKTKSELKSNKVNTHTDGPRYSQGLRSQNSLTRQISKLRILSEPIYYIFDWILKLIWFKKLRITGGKLRIPNSGHKKAIADNQKSE